MYDLNKDYREFVNFFSFHKEFEGKKFLITGATGLIGKTLTQCLLALNIPMKITLPVRNRSKAELIYGRENSKLEIVECDLVDYLHRLVGHYDYIIHCASPTAGKIMIANPVETFELAFESTKEILRFARESSVKSIVYVSSLEYYGQVNDERKITEDDIGYVDYHSARSSYPLGKRAAEYLCYAYAKEYHIPVKMARLTQTFGPGILKTDNRVFAQFARAAINSDDIVLKSTGNSSKPYCYVFDAVSGILTILLKGTDGEAYNVSNDVTYISVNDMAQMIKDNFNPQINIIHDYDPNSGYAPDTLLHLVSTKLQDLGWQPKYGLLDMFKRLISYLRD